ncbi:MAG: glutathione S-transferase N-terminal domain-containing protein [Spirochaetales bacterium]|nr:glutathione S-transferase N-terminal domain-containing protein [Spirochaetales bacterium]
MAITVYSTPSCGFCVRVKNYFKEKGVSFTDYNVADNREKAEEMVKKSGQMGVPVIDINGKIIIGFNKPEIDKALVQIE